MKQEKDLGDKMIKLFNVLNFYWYKTAAEVVKKVSLLKKYLWKVKVRILNPFASQRELFVLTLYSIKDRTELIEALLETARELDYFESNDLWHPVLQDSFDRHEEMKKNLKKE